MESPTPFRFRASSSPTPSRAETFSSSRPPGRARRGLAVPLVEWIEAGDPRPSGLVLAPTRELASADRRWEMRPLAQSRALSVAAVYGGAGIDRQSKQARRAQHIVVATPRPARGPDRSRAVDLRCVRMLVLDEADRMLDMGFRPPVDRTVSLIRGSARPCSSQPPCTARSPASPASTRMTRAATTTPTGGAARRGKPPLRLGHAGPAEGAIASLSDLDRGLTLVFVRTKGRRSPRQAPARPGHRGAAMHGNKTRVPAEKALAVRPRPRRHLVVTDVAARGPTWTTQRRDHLDAPEDRDGYVHRVGRTDGPGDPARGHFVDPGRPDMGKIARGLHPGEFLAATHAAGAGEENPT